MRVTEQTTLREIEVFLSGQGAYIASLKRTNAYPMEEASRRTRGPGAVFTTRLPPGSEKRPWYMVHIEWEPDRGGPIGGATGDGFTPWEALQNVFASLSSLGFFRKG